MKRYGEGSNPSLQCSVCSKWMRLHGVDDKGHAIQRFYACCGEHGEFDHEKDVCDECCKLKCPYKNARQDNTSNSTVPGLR